VAKLWLPVTHEDQVKRSGGTVFKFRATVVVVLALTCAASGVAAADPVPLGNVDQKVNTFGCKPTTDPPKNCLHLTLGLSSMSVNSVPNMAATAFTREAIVGGIATAKVAGDDPGWSKKVNNLSVGLGLQLACQIKVGPNQQIGAGGGNFPFANLPVPSATLFMGPGTNEIHVLSKKAVQNPIPDDAGNITLHAWAHEWYVTMDACAGPVSLRLIAYADLETVDDTEHEVVSGDIVQI
jgi:hypothetical protein